MMTSTMIRKEKYYFEQVMLKTQKELKLLKSKVPNGAKLRVIKHGKNYQYFMRTQRDEKTGVYIKKKDRDKARFLAQIEYDEKLISNIKSILETLDALEDDWIDNCFITTRDMLYPYKRDLITMPYVPVDEVLRDWLNQEYTGVEFYEDAPEYYSRKGLRVRSKSEKIIADMLDEMELPFLYEKPLCLGGDTFHPDFTLFNLRNRKEIYWEHFGMMDSVGYGNKAFSKMKKYELYGLCQYRDLIWTFETSRYSMNTKAIQQLIEELKIKLGYAE